MAELTIKLILLIINIYNNNFHLFIFLINLKFTYLLVTIFQFLHKVIDYKLNSINFCNNAKSINFFRIIN